MCLIAFDYRPDAPAWLRLIANRDEFFSRATAPLDAWPEAPEIVGGRDLVAGGSWLAVHRRGRVAAVTNVRDAGLVTPPDAPSRGQLVPEALRVDDLAGWLDSLAEGDAWRYAGFNLLVGDHTGLWHLHRGRADLRLQRLPAGLHGLSNASLNTPWPKVALARQGLAESLVADDWPQASLSVMHDPDFSPAPDELPDTGVGLELERRLAPPFIRGDTYGTRATTWLEWQRNGRLTLGERRFGPNARCQGESRLALSPTDWDARPRV
ncbi:NRDE family protein [Halomonas sp. YLGW01]|uniref:NRDE family protein n=1 Tax=Halomonas sp. YLGW01 TaxID=2773308 RepID=UPI00177EA84B|nr:NRDE family protein [Halomonas sp. YLGW01]